MPEPQMISPAARELECPKCGTVALNRDFCACGEYLGWELVLATDEDAPAPAAQPPGYRPPEPAEARPATLLTLRDPARVDDPSAAVAVSVVPGIEVAVLATLRNQGEIVDTYDLRVDGLPESWWTISTPTVFLNPWGTAGDYQQDVLVRLHPPRTPASEARAWPLMVVARSRTRGVDVAWVPATLTVQPFQNTVMHVAPERRRGRRHAQFEVAVTNQGNCPMEIVVGATDTEASCPVAVYPERTLVPVGGTGVAVVRVGVARPILVGRPADHQVDVTHRVSGVESEPVPRRVVFRQKPWLPWWLPATVLAFATVAIVVALLKRDTEVPKLKGSTVPEALVILEKHGLQLGRTTYATAPKGAALGTVIAQSPAGGDGMEKGERVNITLAAPAKTGVVPPVNGMTLAQAADALTGAKFGYSPQPSSAGNDWVVIRQDPAPGTKRALGSPVILAVEDPTPADAATPSQTPTPSPSPTPTVAAAKAASAKSAAAPKKAPVAKKPTATAAKAAKLPSHLVFAGATSGQLYQWTSADKQAARLTAAKYRLETPTRTDNGYAAVHVTGKARHLVRISADGTTVEPLADGDYHRPVFSKDRGLLAFIDRTGKGPADAGRVCVLDPQDPVAPTCAKARGLRLGRPTWAPDGRSVLALATGGAGTYTRLVSYAATGGDASTWKAPKTAYRAGSIRSAAWVGNQRLAVLVADHAAAPAHLRLLTRRPDGTFAPLKDFPSLTGHELAASGRHVALRGGERSSADGTITLLDVTRERPRVGRLPNGVNPAWAG
ncbi:PASTA domain-containing protein [Solirubrobacter pauli]|uniref:PASTA domain-containing protein n=1 Tax=Solirubrobacter pauli TaxID=166793 RepID=A0A660L827_9ACTN|nr:PASTA domain-containing protein [Solirubrobacter pauli]RKQ91207.1 PASTA domain-containing protein [Solirubrobacter pauli]